MANRTAVELKIVPSEGEAKNPPFIYFTNRAPMLCQYCLGHQEGSSDQNRTLFPGGAYRAGDGDGDGGWTGIKISK